MVSSMPVPRLTVALPASGPHLTSVVWPAGWPACYTRAIGCVHFFVPVASAAAAILVATSTNGVSKRSSRRLSLGCGTAGARILLGSDASRGVYGVHVPRAQGQDDSGAAGDCERRRSPRGGAGLLADEQGTSAPGAVQGTW